MWGVLIADDGCEPECFDTREEAAQHLFEHAAEYSPVGDGQALCFNDEHGDLAFDFTYTLEEMVTCGYGDCINLSIPGYDGELATMAMSQEQALRLAATLINAVAGKKPMQAHQTEVRQGALMVASETCMTWSGALCRTDCIICGDPFA
jgi:hypothetical protein